MPTAISMAFGIFHTASCPSLQSGSEPLAPKYGRVKMTNQSQQTATRTHAYHLAAHERPADGAPQGAEHLGFPAP